MKKSIALIIAFLYLASCASINPYNLAEGEGAYLKNRQEHIGKAKFIYLFNDAITSTGKKSFDPDINTAEWDTIYNVPSGELTLGLRIIYFPEAGLDPTVGEALKLGFTFLFSSESRSRVFGQVNHYLIWVINPEDKISGLEGVKINALEGITYRINSKIEDGKAYIWIEDDNDVKVSETVRGISAEYPNYWLWDTLPPPVH